MKKSLPILGILAASLWLSPGHASTQQATLSVPSMDCPTCPITIKKALLKVPGVSKASVSFDKKQALVTFDDATTNLTALTAATENAGYPSVLVNAVKVSP